MTPRATDLALGDPVVTTTRARTLVEIRCAVCGRLLAEVHRHGGANVLVGAERSYDGRPGWRRHLRRVALSAGEIGGVGITTGLGRRRLIDLGYLDDQPTTDITLDAPGHKGTIVGQRELAMAIRAAATSREPRQLRVRAQRSCRR